VPSVALRVSELGLDFNRLQSNGTDTVCGRNSAVVANLRSTGLDIDQAGCSESAAIFTILRRLVKMVWCKSDFQLDSIRILKEDRVIAWTVFWTFTWRIENSNVLRA
jgi:hypothetical protein